MKINIFAPIAIFMIITAITISGIIGEVHQYKIKESMETELERDFNECMDRHLSDITSTDGFGNGKLTILEKADGNFNVCTPILSIINDTK